ncbi:platelet-derived growth factor receptor-like protein [Pristis pectinata]|uniref:platelet-derived growth factor receptor-like protein n=1 Tax=Pristis pectinata TaxID=685728 RepID=UPI00223D6541|nr:platelet-derived growth factor receptor-like protein [Pristis pectinata]
MKFYVVLLFVFFTELLLQMGDCQKKEKRTPQRMEKIKQRAAGQNKIRVIDKKHKARGRKLRKERVFVDRDLKPTFIMTQVLDKGRFQKPAETLNLTIGQSLELRCKGDNIGWAYPSHLNNSRLSIIQHQKYSQLTLNNPRTADTGEYSCWVILCDGLECSKDDLKMGKTYIFFTDPAELFVPSINYFDIIYLRSDQPAIIPCRVSTPLAYVTLHREFPPQEIPADGSLISYDAKKGFIIHQPKIEQKGIVHCMANLKGARQTSNNYLLLYAEALSGPPTASIEASTNTVSGGEQVNVTCTVLGDPDLQVNFTWKYPGQQDERPVIITESWRLIDQQNGHTVRLSKSMLYIDDIETIDVGSYICTAQNLIGETTVATEVLFHW